ncbi:hypothetical protein KAR91_45260 [Candidatus Pacearchaeota archaeon]|nr:hypothetical protein [Candidatus Pacearchaeota archaeon]
MAKLIRNFNNQRVTATIGVKEYHFRSKLEYRWSLYLEFLKQGGEIQDWFYEKDLFVFPGETTAPVRYLMDFTIIDKDGSTYYNETKGYHDGSTNTKLRRTAKYYPDAIVELVLMSIPKKNKAKGASRRRIAAKYTRRIIDASVIFKQLKGVINFDTPIITESGF